MLKSLSVEHPLPEPLRLADRRTRRPPKRLANSKRPTIRQVAFQPTSDKDTANISFYPEDDTDHEHDHQDKQHKRNTNNTHQLEYRHPPFFITFISIFQLCTFVYYAFRSEEAISLIGPVPFKSKLIYNPYRRYEIWRHLTYMLIHAGYWHISFNVLVQLAIGVPLETVHSFTPIFIVYTGGVIGGALGNSVADPHSYLAGASSGSYALIAAHLSELIMNWNEVRGACLKLIAFVIFCSADITTAIYERHYRGSIAYRTSYGGHLAGALSGLLLGLVYLQNTKVHRWETKVSRFAAALYVSLIVSTPPLFSLILYDDVHDHPTY